MHTGFSKRHLTITRLKSSTYLVEAGYIDVFSRLRTVGLAFGTKEVLLQRDRSKALIEVEHSLVQVDSERVVISSAEARELKIQGTNYPKN